MCVNSLFCTKSCANCSASAVKLCCGLWLFGWPGNFTLQFFLMCPCLPHLWQIIELGYCLFLFIPAPDLNPGTTYMAPNSILSSCCLVLRGWNLGWCPDERYNAESACSTIISAVMMSGGRASLTCSYTVGFKPLMNWNKIDWSSGLSFPSSTTVSLKRSMYLVTEVVCFRQSLDNGRQSPSQPVYMVHIPEGLFQLSLELLKWKSCRKILDPVTPGSPPC